MSGCSLSLRQTEEAIVLIKRYFEDTLAAALHLSRVSAPLFVDGNSGLNDNLSGVERPVSFNLGQEPACNLEIVHSLAKWKRMALARYRFAPGEGLYTDMNAIRRDETLDAIHSIYVDQWDWEAIIDPSQRNIDTLEQFVRNIYQSIYQTHLRVCDTYPVLERYLPEQIVFITSQALEDCYPGLTPGQREAAFARKHGAIFIEQIGGALASGQRHDNRAPDYDDWMLNGDLIVFYPLLDRAVELSSMGIRVDAPALARQLQIAGCPQRSELPFQKSLLDGKLPQTIGGGIGQSRLCMMLLGKTHIGQVQASYWPNAILTECLAQGIELL